MPLLVMVQEEGVLLALSNPVEHPSVSSWIPEGGQRGGFAFAIQLHREVRPESGLVGIAEHI